ncbi:MAG: L,D-transpeptidase [Lachnospiraceae bacterium]
MWKKILKITGIVLLSAFAAACIVYLVIAFYYRQTFLYGTYINGVSVKGLDVAGADALLAKEYAGYTLTLKERDGKTEMIDGEQIGFSASFTKELTNLLNHQNALLWGYYFIVPVSLELVPEFTYQEENLKEALESLTCFQLEAANLTAKLEIQKKYLGYVLIDETTDIVETQVVNELVRQALDEGSTSVSIEECFVPYLPTKEMQEVYGLWKKIDKVQRTNVVLEDDGLERTLNAGIIVDWIVADGDGMPVLDEAGQIQLKPEMVGKFVEELSALFDTDKKDRLWKKKDGGSVWLKYAAPGYQIDQEAEIEQLTKAALTGKSEKREPIYAKEGKGRGKEEIGDTYIEIDMNAQKLYYFVDGKLRLTTDIVTGNTSRRNGTPAKICAIYAKQKNRVLRGANYASFVNYWMPVSGNIGIHDATWRDEFGGEIYKTAGSHGCINLPKEKAEALYEMAEVGTPVILYN